MTNPYAASNVEPTDAAVPTDSARLPLALLGSFAVMIPWPLIGIGLSYRMFDHASDGMYFFGGFTLLATLPLMFAGIDLADSVCEIIMIVGWVSVFLIPSAILRSLLRS